MSDRIKVLPNKASAVGMAHPVDGPLKADGSLWIHDVFTSRRLVDGSIVRAPDEPVVVEGAEKTPDAALNEADAKVLPGLKKAAAEQKTAAP